MHTRNLLKLNYTYTVTYISFTTIAHLNILKYFIRVYTYNIDNLDV